MTTEDKASQNKTVLPSGEQNFIHVMLDSPNAETPLLESAFQWVLDEVGVNSVAICTFEPWAATRLLVKFCDQNSWEYNIIEDGRSSSNFLLSLRHCSSRIMITTSIQEVMLFSNPPKSKISVWLHVNKLNDLNAAMAPLKASLEHSLIKTALVTIAGDNHG